MNRFLKIQRDRAISLYHRVRNLWPIWYYLLNFASRRVLRKNAALLGGIEARIVHDLKESGIAIASLWEIFGNDVRLDDLLRETELRKATARSSEQSVSTEVRGRKGFDKKFMEYYWGGGGSNPTIEPSSRFVRAALDERVLRIAGEYFGSAPKLHGFSLQSTVVVPKGSPELLSQRWHRDPDDKKICKMFIYLNDVADAGGGPFMYVAGSQLGGKWRGLFPQRPPVGRYPEPGTVEAAVPASDRLMCTGRAGTIIFCDTSGLHRGGYSTERSRTMFAVGFASTACIYPRNCIVPPSVITEAPSPLARYALE